MVLDPAEERIKSEFAGVKRSFLPLHSVIRIDEVKKQGGMFKMMKTGLAQANEAVQQLQADQGLVESLAAGGVDGKATIKSQVATGKYVNMQPELQFEPEANASYDLSAKVLNIIKASGVTKFGFVGNEKYRVFGKA